MEAISLAAAKKAEKSLTAHFQPQRKFVSIIAQLLEAEDVRSPKESLSNSLLRTGNGRSAYLWVIKSRLMSAAGRSACILWVITCRARTEDRHSVYNLWVVKARLRTEDGTIGLFCVGHQTGLRTEYGRLAYFLWVISSSPLFCFY